MFITLIALIATAASAGTAPLAVRLHYFDSRGLGESVRLTLAELGIMWEEVAHSGESWKEAKPHGVESGFLTFGQIPLLEYTDSSGKNFTMVQSQAILQFLGRRHGLYSSDSMSDEEVIKTDVVMGGVADVKKRYGKMAYAKASELEKELEEYKTFLSTWLPYFERLAPARGLAAEADSFTIPEYISGPFSIADALVYDMLDTCVRRVDPGALKPFPKLRALMKRIEQRPNIATYLKSPRRRNYANGPAASYDTLSNPPAHLKASEEL
mmetsp:Transcript_60838/g.114732  ORF Transcript_60838/g.114732 Transcript_60838/m.114732 type:complete len:268 (-) Transcript_60838:125-928(-)